MKHIRSLMIGLVLMISAAFSMPALADMHIPIADAPHEAVDFAVQIPLADVAGVAVSDAALASAGDQVCRTCAATRSYSAASYGSPKFSALLASSGPGDEDENPDPGGDLRVIRT